MPSGCEEGRLFSAVASGDLDEVKRLVIDCGLDPNVKDYAGSTPLHYAARGGRPNVVKLLLEHGADPNVQNVDGNTPLHYAISEGHPDIVKLLLEYRNRRQNAVT